MKTALGELPAFIYELKAAVAILRALDAHKAFGGPVIRIPASCVSFASPCVP